MMGFNMRSAIKRRMSDPLNRNAGRAMTPPNTMNEAGKPPVADIMRQRDTQQRGVSNSIYKPEMDGSKNVNSIYTPDQQRSVMSNDMASPQVPSYLQQPKAPSIHGAAYDAAQGQNTFGGMSRNDWLANQAGIKKQNEMYGSSQAPTTSMTPMAKPIQPVQPMTSGGTAYDQAQGQTTFNGMTREQWMAQRNADKMKNIDVAQGAISQPRPMPFNGMYQKARY